MRKIYLWKFFEKGIINNKSIITTEKENDIEEFIITNVENLKEKQQFYYNNLDEMCRFKTNKNRSVINVNFGEE